VVRDRPEPEEAVDLPIRRKGAVDQCLEGSEGVGGELQQGGEGPAQGR